MNPKRNNGSSGALGARRGGNGFSLIELMVTVAILAIIATIAIPIYTDQVQRTRRADAKTALTQTAQTLERCYTQYNAYNDTNCSVVSAGPTVSLTSDEGYYKISSPTLNASSYTLQAAPAAGSPQNSDTDCKTFTLSSTGQKQATGDDPGACW